MDYHLTTRGKKLSKIIGGVFRGKECCKED